MQFKEKYKKFYDSSRDMREDQIKTALNKQINIKVSTNYAYLSTHLKSRKPLYFCLTNEF